MFIRRISEHLKAQNWIAIGLELTVVVVGIFLGFQVDRWYEQKQLQSEERDYLVALSEDFAATRESFVGLRDRHKDATESAVRLLSYRIGDPIDLTHKGFYELLSDIQLIRAATERRGSYDLLISSGKIDLIRDENLRTQMSDFFAQVDGTSSDMRDDLQSFWRDAFEPYAQKNLDHVALMQAVHPRDNMSLQPTYPLDHYHAIIGTGEFEAIVSDKWHLSSDLVLNYEARIEDIQSIEILLAENLARFASGDSLD